MAGCDARRFAETRVLELVPLPCWDGLSPEVRRSRIARLIQQIEAEAAALRKASGLEPVGREAIERQNPFERLKKPKQSSAPHWPTTSAPPREYPGTYPCNRPGGGNLAL